MKLNDIQSLEEIYNNMVLNESKGDVVVGKEKLSYGDCKVDTKTGPQKAGAEKPKKAEEELQGVAPKKSVSVKEGSFDDVFAKILQEAEDEDMLPEDEPVGDLDLENEEPELESEEGEFEEEEEIDEEGDSVEDLVSDLAALRDQIDAIISKVSSTVAPEEENLEGEEELMDEFEDEIDEIEDEEGAPEEEEEQLRKESLQEAKKAGKCTVGKIKPKSRSIKKPASGKASKWQKAPSKFNSKTKPVVSKPQID